MAGLASWAALAQAAAAVFARAWDAFAGWCSSRGARERRAAYEKAVAEWKAAIRSGDAMRMMEAKRKIDAMRKAGWHRFTAIALALSILVGGCIHWKMDTAPVGEHIRLLVPGDVVPPFPEDGQDYWLLVSPRGLEWMLPEDSPFLGEALQ